MDIAILVLLLLDLVLTAGVFYNNFTERRGNRPEPEGITMPGHAGGVPLQTDEAARPEKYTEPSTQTLKVAPSGPQPPFGPPMIGPDTLKMALIHRYLDDNVWGRFVDKFYVLALQDYRVRALFEGKDVSEVKKKFLATLLIMFDKGVSEAAAAGLTKVHARLEMDEYQYNYVMGALEQTLVEFRVPEGTIAQCVPMIDYFRETMVTA